METLTRPDTSRRVCFICNSKAELQSWAIVRPAISNLIKEEHSTWGPGLYICHKDLATYRYKYFKSILESERGELSTLDNEVLESLKNHETISEDISQEYRSKLTFGENLSDKISTFGGSWKFINIFLFVLFLWIILNTFILVSHRFDPYPYILLNLVLSCVAAIQAPVIMMSQNRQEARDRMRSENDYKINLKSELEIRQLHLKMDHLLTSQWERMAEIQDIQISLIEELRKKDIKKAKE
jgi:uncharacterized membrane protein